LGIYELFQLEKQIKENGGNIMGTSRKRMADFRQLVVFQQG